MKNRLAFSFFLIASFLLIELSACTDRAEDKKEKEVANTEKSSPAHRSSEDKAGELATKPSNISLPDVITYFMSSF